MVRAKTKLWSSAYYDPIPTLSPCNLWHSRIGKQRLRARPSYLSTTFPGIKWEEKGFRSDFSNLPQSTNQSNIFQLLTLTSLSLSLFFVHVIQVLTWIRWNVHVLTLDPGLVHQCLYFLPEVTSCLLLPFYVNGSLLCTSFGICAPCFFVLVLSCPCPQSCTVIL